MAAELAVKLMVDRTSTVQHQAECPLRFCNQFAEQHRSVPLSTGDVKLPVPGLRLDTAPVKDHDSHCRCHSH